MHYSYKKFFITFLIVVAILTLFWNQKPTVEYCELDYFEKTTKKNFPKEIEIISCNDDLEGDIWVHFSFKRRKDISDFISKMKFQRYSKDATILDNVSDKVVRYSTDDDAIELFKRFMSNNYVEIPKNESTYITNVSKPHQFVTYIVNKDKGLFWGHIAYPDWSGDF